MASSVAKLKSFQAGTFGALAMDRNHGAIDFAIWAANGKEGSGLQISLASSGSRAGGSEASSSYQRGAWPELSG